MGVWREPWPCRIPSIQYPSLACHAPVCACLAPGKGGANQRETEAAIEALFAVPTPLVSLRIPRSMPDFAQPIVALATVRGVVVTLGQRGTPCVSVYVCVCVSRRRSSLIAISIMLFSRLARIAFEKRRCDCLASA